MTVLIRKPTKKIIQHRQIWRPRKSLKKLFSIKVCRQVKDRRAKRIQLHRVYQGSATRTLIVSNQIGIIVVVIFLTGSNTSKEVILKITRIASYLQQKKFSRLPNFKQPAILYSLGLLRIVIVATKHRLKICKSISRNL